MKYKRLKILRENKINIPSFFLYENNLEKIKLFKEKRIILRSSYKKEDWEKKSFAGIFNSIWNVKKENIDLIKENIDLIKKDAFIKIKNIKANKKDFNIIIQEYIKTDLWGVIFMEWEKFLIELNSWFWAEKVVVWDIKESIYVYKKFVLHSWEKILNKKRLKKILIIVKKIKKIFDFDLDIEFWIKNNNIFIFQVRPITKKVLSNYYLLDNSNIWENFTWTTSNLTASFVKNLYSKVYKSVFYNSGISFKKIAKLEHIFDNLIIFKENKLYYNIFSWYKTLLLLPWNNKKSFDNMIWTKLKLKYLVIDDIYKYFPNIFFKIKYFFIIIYKIISFDFKIKKLEKYLKNFYKDFENINLKEKNLNDLYLLYKSFEENFCYLWYITIDNDFVIMKFSKNINLWEINWLSSAEQIYFLQEVAKWKKEKKEYLEKYGYRFWDELKLETADIDEKPWDFEKILEKYKNLKIEKKDNIYKKNFLFKYIKNREKFRLYRSKNFSIARKIFLEIWERFKKEKIIDNKNDIFNFELNQIFEKIISFNKINIKNSDRNLIWKSFKWKVYIMNNFHIPKEKIEILVAQNFDPWWIVLLWWVKWIILENWNYLSHISIICRELNINLLIWDKNATSKYKTWDFLEINNNWEVKKWKNI